MTDNYAFHEWQLDREVFKPLAQLAHPKKQAFDGQAYALSRSTMYNIPSSQQLTPSISDFDPRYRTDLAQTSTPTPQASQSLITSRSRTDGEDGDSKNLRRRPPQPHPYSSPSKVPTSVQITVASRIPVNVLTASDAENPQLIRTSTIQQLHRAANTGLGLGVTTAAFCPDKAVLKIESNLNQMVESWTNDEKARKRRLVQFERAQRGSTVIITCASISTWERLKNSFCISCIWWKEKQEHFVTSVDIISLLEFLVAEKFNIEEKNRIRRNLEEFDPLTVCKSKSGTDNGNFFKVIMGFPNPKPRNIEQAIKVFRWRVLADALQKIIGKYSVSYSSIASMVPSKESDATPLPSMKPLSSTEVVQLQQWPSCWTHVTEMYPAFARPTIPRAHLDTLQGYTTDHPADTNDARYAIYAPGPDWTYDPYPPNESPSYMPPAAVPTLYVVPSTQSD